MSIYLDASALVKRFVPHEPDHAQCIAIMDAHEDWITSRISLVEAPRAISRGSSDAALLSAFDADTAELLIVEVDHAVSALARAIALETGVRTLDALHLASAKRVMDPDLIFLTYDERQLDAAEAIGLPLATRAQ